MQSALWRALVVFACGVAHAAWAAGADDAAVRASAGILMSRGMDTKDRVAAADSLARYLPRAAVPILIEALNETSEPVRRAAARGLWTIARDDNPDDAAAARAATPALRIALSDVSVSVAMNAAEALERLGEPASALAECRRKALRAPPPFAYERFLAARGLIGIDPGARAHALCARLAVRRIQAPRFAGQLGRARQHPHRQRRTDAPRADRRSRRARRARRRAQRRSAGNLRPSSRAGDRETLARSFRAHARDRVRCVARGDGRDRIRTDGEARRSRQLERVGAGGRARARGPAPAGGGRASIEERRRQDAGRHARACAPRGKQRTRSGARGRARRARGRQRRDARASAAVLAAAKPAALQAFRSVLAREPAGPPFDEAAARPALHRA